MKCYILRPLLFIILLIAAVSSAVAEPGRWETDLSGDGWKLWLDYGAVWYNDAIHLPPVDVESLPVNTPTGGWNVLEGGESLDVTVPGTVEEYYWGEIGGVEPNTGGDYIGVSWWSRTFHVPATLEGKRIVLDFESVNLRAEVFVNHRLVGYDVIGNTPFEVDATDAIRFGGENRIDIRITDPVGDFSWDDNILMRWGDNLIPAVHGFGGITGPLVIRATDAVHVDDIYVQNKPDPKKAEVFVTIGNSTGRQVRGNVTLTVHESGNPAAVVWQRRTNATIPAEGGKVTFNVNASQAKLWELSGWRTFKEAALYEASVTFVSDDDTILDTAGQRFGFRWFTVGEKDGDKRFYLNGKRVFIIAAMTRGFWPTNGIFATPEMAKRDMESLIDLGYNMMLLHRAIGQPPVMEYADRMGLFTYEEPGGYRIMPNRADNIDGPDDQARALRREKLRRMIIRDRSLPSMIIYNFKNEATKAPDEDDIANMKMVHELDPSRILTYNSDRNREIDYSERIEPDPYKLNMLPFDDALHYSGWWDHHHWFDFAGYVDDNYENPRYFVRGVVDAPRAPARSDSLLRLRKDEVIFWGEEGAFGTMVALGKIHDRLMVTSASGFREMEHLDWYDYYDNWLDDSGFRSAYPTVDALTMSLGRNLHYFHGRNMENIRISNIADAVNINGWGSASTRTDIVDMYRNPTSDPAILQHYSQPLYVAVKLRDKVMPVGFAPVADIWIVNELDLKGSHSLELTLSGPDDLVRFTTSYPVKITGGEQFGELLVEGVELPAVDMPGYYRLDARIVLDNIVKATGFDDIYAVDHNGSARISGTVAVIESDGTVANFLHDSRGITPRPYTVGMNADVIIVGAHDFDNGDQALYRAAIERAAAGARLIVLERADKWAELLNTVTHVRPAIYAGGGISRRGNSGRLFVGESPFLAGLPQAQGMSWEYQTFYHTSNVTGIRLDTRSTDVIAAMGTQGDKEILCSLGRIPLGGGDVILSTLEIGSRLGSNDPQAAVAKKVFLNLIEVKGE